MEYSRRITLFTRLLCVLLMICILAPNMAVAASASVLIDPTLLYDQLAGSNQSKIYVISEDEFVVLVQSPIPNSEQMKNESGMTVTIKTEDTWQSKNATQTKTTDANGMAIFKISDFRTQEHQQASRYFYAEVTINDPSGSRPGWYNPDARLYGGMKMKYIISQTVSEPYVYEASFNKADILYTDYKAQITPKNDANHDIKIVVDPGRQNPSSVTFRLMSGGKKLDEQTVNKTNGKFVCSFSKKWLSTSGLTIGEPVRVEYTAGSVTKSVKLNLVVEKAKKEEPQTNKDDKEVNLGFSVANGELVVTIPNGIPFIGGYKTSIKVPNLPITFYLDTDGKFMLGFTLEYSKEPFSKNEEDKSWKRTNPWKVENWIQENWDKYQKDKEKIKSQVTPLKGMLGSTPWMPKFKLTFQIGGMFKCMNLYAKSDKNVTVSASTFASIAGDLSVRKYLFAGPIPFFIGGNLKGSIMASYEYAIIVNQGDPLKTMKKTGDDTPVDIKAGLDLSASLGVSVTAGIGFEKFLSIWAEGSVTALPSISIKAQTRPEEPFPWYVFKLNFGLRAGVRLIFTSYEITPLSYNYVIADNHDPKSKPYWQRISGPWTPNPLSGDTGGGTIGSTETGITQGELDSICLGSVTFNAEAEKQPDENGDYPDYPITAGDSGLAGSSGYGLDSLSFTLDGSRWDFAAATSAPYENDAQPYDFDYGAGAWEQGKSDGLGIVVPDKTVKLLDNGYADPKLQYLDCDGKHFLFFIAVVEVNGIKVPTLVYCELDAENKIKDGKLHPIVFGTETAQSPRYVSDYDVACRVIDGNLCFETVVSYSKSGNMASSAMGVYTRPFIYKNGQTVYGAARKEMKTKYFYEYKALMPTIAIDYFYYLGGQRGEQVCVSYLLQYDVAYQSRPLAKPTVMMYSRNFGRADWSDYAEVWEHNYPVANIVLGTGKDYDHTADVEKAPIIPLWRVAVEYHESVDKPETGKIFCAYYRTSFDDNQNHGTLKWPDNIVTTEVKGHALERLEYSLFTFIGTDGNLWFSAHDLGAWNYTCGYSMPSEGNRVLLSSTDTEMTYLCYWPEKVKVHNGTPAPNPKPDKEYTNLMGRYFSLKWEDSRWSKIRTSRSFILCKSEDSVDYLRAYPLENGYCGLYYTSSNNKLLFTSDIYFARVPIVDAAEVVSMAPNDPCIAQGEVFRMYTNLENAGNTFLGSTKIQFTYKAANNNTTQEKTIDFLDCNKMAPTVNEFDFSELKDDDDYYSLVKDVTLAAAMKDPEMSAYFDAAVYSDASDTGYQQDQVKLKYYAPGDLHLYIVDGLQIPKAAKGWVTIDSKLYGFTRKSVWDLPNDMPQDHGASAIGESDVLGGTMYRQINDGDYTVVTDGAETKVGFADVGIEGQLVRAGAETYMELNLRNETTNPCNALLKIYGDSTLLLQREFHNIASGSIPKLTADGLAMPDGDLEEYYNGTQTEGASGNENGYISLTFPVKALVQGRQFYKLTAVVETATGLSIEGDESDSVELVLMQDGGLVFTAEPQDVNATLGGDTSINASFKGGIAPYRVGWQKQDATGDWIDMNSGFVKTGATEYANNVISLLFSSASAATGDISTSLMFYHVKQEDAALYRCLVMDQSGQWIASQGARLNPISPVPVTGDNVPTGLLIFVSGLSLCGLAALMLTRRRKHRKTK